MNATVRSLWQDEAGFIISAELVMVGTLLVIGLIAGAACVQDAVIGEYTEVAGALRGLDQSYSYSGMQGCWDPCCGFGSWTAGSAYYQNPEVREVCFGLCPPGVIDCAPVVVAPVVVAPPCVAVVPVPDPCMVQPAPPCVTPPLIATVMASPPGPCVTAVWEPRPCPCELSDCPPADDGACPLPTVFPLPGPFVW